MIGSAQFCALSTVGTDLVSFYPALINITGYRIFLDTESRDPPCVDDIVRGEQQTYFLVNRDNDTVIDV